MSKILFLATLLLLGSCSLVQDLSDLQVDLDSANAEMRLIAGRIVPTNDISHTGHTIAALLSPKSHKVLSYQVLGEKQNEFALGHSSSEPILFVFKDENADFKYQAGEPASISADLLVESPPTLDTEHWAFNIVSLKPRSSELAIPNLDLSKEDSISTVPYLSADIGSLISFDERKFQDSVTRIGLWQPYRFINEVGYGFYLAQPWDPDRGVVLFVHGINSSPKVWRDLIPQLDWTYYQPVFFHYPSGAELEASASIMSYVATEMRHRFPDLEVRIVAHSMGGLIIKRYLQIQHQNEVPVADRILTISTPWAGHDGARLGVEYAPVVAPVWRDMNPESKFLSNLNQRGLPPQVDHTLLFSFSPKETSSENIDGTVSLASQLDSRSQVRANRIHGIDKGHQAVVSASITADYINHYILRPTMGITRMESGSQTLANLSESD
ncbi:lipase family alpha/beta hydrolase [Aurantivibrio plasticivorans]